MKLPKTTLNRGGGKLKFSFLAVTLLCNAVSFLSFAAERSFCDLGKALNPADNTNGGFWSIANRDNAVVYDSSSSAVSVTTAPGSRRISAGTNLYSVPAGIIIGFR